MLGLPHYPSSLAILDCFTRCLLECRFIFCQELWNQCQENLSFAKINIGCVVMLLPPISQSPATSSAALGHVINYFRLMFWVSSLDILTNSNDLDYDCEACFLESSNGLVSHGFSTVSCAHSSWGAPGVSSDSFKVASIYSLVGYISSLSSIKTTKHHWGNAGILGGSPHYMPGSN